MEGKSFHCFGDVLKNFGLEWEKLDWNEKRVVSNYIFETYRLEAFEKGYFSFKIEKVLNFLYRTTQ